MNFQQANQFVQQQLAIIYDAREAKNIATILLEEVTNLSATERLIKKDQQLLIQQETMLQLHLAQLLQHKPLQQVLGYAWFCSNRFVVNQHVLIPRPETEELVTMFVAENSNKPVRILDIGTGSGCIAITIKKQMPNALVTAIDISKEALAVAIENATQLDADINFMELDFLNANHWQRLPQFDVIVSNPPYIQQKESSEMRNNVLQYEPHTALFVSNDTALVFYETMVQFACTHLAHNGSIWVEINESLGKETALVFEKNNYSTTLIKDMQEKYRMIKAYRH